MYHNIAPVKVIGQSPVQSLQPHSCVDGHHIIRIIVTISLAVAAPNQSLWPALPSPLFLLHHRRDRRCAKSDWIYWILSIVLCTRTSRVVMRNTYFIDKYLANIFMNYYCHIIAVGKKSVLLKMYSTCHICVIYWLPKISPSYIPYSDHKSSSLEPSTSSVALLVCWHIEAREDSWTAHLSGLDIPMRRVLATIRSHPRRISWCDYYTEPSNGHSNSNRTGWCVANRGQKDEATHCHASSWRIH